MRVSLFVMCAAAFLASGAAADAKDTNENAPIELSTAQMDDITAGGFVCPVFNADAVGAHNPNAVFLPGGGDSFYSIIGPDVSVPDRATNAGGAGSPMGAHSSPGDTDYTAIWQT